MVQAVVPLLLQALLARFVVAGRQPVHAAEESAAVRIVGRIGGAASQQEQTQDTGITACECHDRDLPIPGLPDGGRGDASSVVVLDGHAVVNPLQAGDVLTGFLPGFLQFHQIGLQLPGILILRSSLLLGFLMDLLGIGQLFLGQ